MSFWYLLRLIFVVFFLYLVGDAFYRWDGFKYYASFAEFLPSVALISVLWSILAVLAALVIWLPLNILIWICQSAGLRVSREILVLNTVVLLTAGSLVWVSKKIIWPEAQTALQVKIAILLSVALILVFLTLRVRNKAEGIYNAIFERITPLVWLFGIIVVLSFPVVIFYAFWEAPVESFPTETVEPAGDVRDRPNIILVTYDALTARDMSLYGYQRETTPFISEWAKSATVFNRCEAAANTTSQTVASLMTGKRVWSHRRYQSDAGKPDRIKTENLPLLLKNNGYYNMAFIANEIASVKKLGLSESFHVMPSASDTMEPASLYGFIHKSLIKYFSAKIKLHDWLLKEDFILSMLLHVDIFRYPYKTEFPVRRVYDMFLREMNEKVKKPFFAWIHIYPPHAPYLPPDNFMGMFEPSDKYRAAKSQFPLINQRYYDEEMQPDADILRGRYNEFIRYCDAEFAYLIGQLKARNILENTVVIVSSDHGESFERGYFTHGGHFLFEEMTHIPLIIKKPEQTLGGRYDLPVEQTDIPATILELAQIPVPGWMDGRSLAPLLESEYIEPKPVFSMSMEENRDRGKISKGIFAVWDRNYKLIHYITSKKSYLFNLDRDPYERDDLFASEGETGRRLLNILQENLEKANEKAKAKE